MSAPGGVCSWGVSTPWGVSAPGGSAPRGMSALGGAALGVSAHGGLCIPACTEADTPPVKRITDTVKT